MCVVARNQGDVRSDSAVCFPSLPFCTGLAESTEEFSKYDERPLALAVGNHILLHGANLAWRIFEELKEPTLFDMLDPFWSVYHDTATEHWDGVRE